MPIFLMRLHYRHDLLDNHQFLVLVNLVKDRLTPGDVKPVDYNSAPEDQVFLIPLAPWERIRVVLIIRRILSGRRLISSATSCQRIRLKVNPQSPRGRRTHLSCGCSRSRHLPQGSASSGPRSSLQ